MLLIPTTKKCPCSSPFTVCQKPVPHLGRSIRRDEKTWQIFYNFLWPGIGFGQNTAMNQTQLVFLESVSSDPRMHFCLAERYHCSKLQQLMKGSSNFFSTKIADLFQEKPTHDNTDIATTHINLICAHGKVIWLLTRKQILRVCIWSGVWCLINNLRVARLQCGSRHLLMRLPLSFNSIQPFLGSWKSKNTILGSPSWIQSPKKNSAWPCFQIWKRKNMEKRWCWIEFPLDQSTEFCVTTCNLNRDGDLPWRILLLISYWNGSSPS